MRPVLTLIFLIVMTSLSAQTKQYGKIKLTEQKDITNLLEQSEEDLSGYRIQVFTGNASERQKAHAIKTFIENNFEVNAYVDYESPLFKVRVGDFCDKFEAVTLKHRLKEHYNNAYLVKVKSINL